MYYYYMYNFIIESDFEIQACDKLIFPSKNNKFEIIKYRRLTQEKKAEIYYCSTYDMFTLKYYPLVAYETDKYIILRYLDYYFVAISLNDNEIIVDLDSVDPKMSVNVAIGGALSICMFLLGYIPLHATALEYCKKPLVFIAPSKTGKSTLAYNLIQNGCQSITDDVLPIKTCDNQLVCYSSKNLKIKIDTFLSNQFNIPLEEVNIVTPLENKYWHPLPIGVHSRKNFKIGYLFYLNPSKQNENVSITALPRVEAIRTLFENVHFIHFLPKAKRGYLLEQILFFFKDITIYSVNYEKKYDAIPNILDSVFEFVKKN